MSESRPPSTGGRFLTLWLGLILSCGFIVAPAATARADSPVQVAATVSVSEDTLTVWQDYSEAEGLTWGNAEVAASAQSASTQGVITVTASDSRGEFRISDATTGDRLVALNFLQTTTATFVVPVVTCGETRSYVLIAEGDVRTGPSSGGAWEDSVTVTYVADDCATSPAEYPLDVTFTANGALAHVTNPTQLTFNDCMVYEDRNDWPITLAAVPSIPPGYQGTYETVKLPEPSILVYVQCADEDLGRRITVGQGSHVYETAATDSDNDGVTDDLDQCPGTPAGQTVNANGCAASQLDSSGKCNAKERVIAALEAKIETREAQGRPTKGLKNALAQQLKQLQKFGCAQVVASP